MLSGEGIIHRLRRFHRFRAKQPSPKRPNSNVAEDLNRLFMAVNPYVLWHLFVANVLNLWNLRNLWINFYHGINLSSFAI